MGAVREPATLSPRCGRDGFGEGLPVLRRPRRLVVGGQDVAHLLEVAQAAKWRRVQHEARRGVRAAGQRQVARGVVELE